ncbi:unnamed protein product [Microthlaspi erraticum]|uniref:F-box associated beta-propeller type 3 domain-containing protein n=1 Tax=Microthlaspi erraticum TaxID=1685480 RepID=A0A6D2JCP1_9BRAS|nr:unnamed protein product [Microthlaspi erraticum]CAA7050780.1 unnamed protein product [Microthlaspi erraticum]
MGSVDLWVLLLEDGGKWSTKSLVFQPCQRHLVGRYMSLHVHGTTQHGEVILAPFKLVSPYYILYYDVQQNDLRKVGIRGIPDHWFGKRDKVYTTLSFYFSIMDTSESIMHLKS